MKFECKDLDRTLAVPELLPDAREHAKTCPDCRRALRLWNEISRIGGQLHQEWESPELWPRIQQSLVAEPKPIRAWRFRHWMPPAGLAAAAAIVFAVFWFRPAPHPKSAPGDRDFLTEQAFQEVEQAEAAYVKSIGKLSLLADPKLDKDSSPLAIGYREKLMVIDSAIADLRRNVDQNRFNTHLRTELAALYREKQQTLQEFLSSGQKN